MNKDPESLARRFDGMTAALERKEHLEEEIEAANAPAVTALDNAAATAAVAKRLRKQAHRLAHTHSYTPPSGSKELPKPKRARARSPMSQKAKEALTALSAAAGMAVER